MGANGPAVGGSAAIHAERIRAREAERAKAAESAVRDPRQTFEVYAERAAAGARADEALRLEAERRAKRARGEWVPGDGEEDDDQAEEEYEEPAEDVEEDVEDEEGPVDTAELYARRERKRIAAEREANIAAWRGSSEVAWRNSVRPI